MSLLLFATVLTPLPWEHGMFSCDKFTHESNSFRNLYYIKCIIETGELPFLRLQVVTFTVKVITYLGNRADRDCYYILLRGDYE